MSDGFFRGSPIGLNMLISEDLDLGKYFMSLPEELRQKVNQRANDIHCADDLYKIVDDFK